MNNAEEYLAARRRSMALGGMIITVFILAFWITATWVVVHFIVKWW